MSNATELEIVQDEGNNNTKQIESLQQNMKNLFFGKKRTQAIELNCINIEETVIEKLTLIGKFLGRYPIKLEEVGKDIHRIWQTKGKITLERLDREHVKMVFESNKEWQHVLHNGPWMLEGQVFSIKEWCRGWSLEDYQFDLVKFWVQVWDLPKERINKANVWKIGAELGKVVEVDISCPPEFNQQVARIRIEMDVKERLQKDQQIKLETGEEIVVRFKYEKLEVFCYFCGVIGHDQLACRMRNQHRYDLLKCGGSLKDVKQHFNSQIKANKFYNGVAFKGKQSFIIAGTPSKLRFEETPASESTFWKYGGRNSTARSKQYSWVGYTSADTREDKTKNKVSAGESGTGFKTTVPTAIPTDSPTASELMVTKGAESDFIGEQELGPQAQRIGVKEQRSEKQAYAEKGKQISPQTYQLGLDLVMKDAQELVGLAHSGKAWDSNMEASPVDEGWVANICNKEDQEEGLGEKCEKSRIEEYSLSDQNAFSTPQKPTPFVKNGASSLKKLVSGQLSQQLQLVEDQAGQQQINHNRPTRGRGFKIMVSRGGRDKGARAELKARLERDEREQGELVKRKEKRKLDLSCDKEGKMVMNGGSGWVRRSKRVVEQRSKKTKKVAAEMRNQEKGHLLIPTNAIIMQVSSDSAVSTSSEEYIDIGSSTDLTPSVSEATMDTTANESGISEELNGEYQATMEYYVSDEEEELEKEGESQYQRGRLGQEPEVKDLLVQPAPLAIDDSTVGRIEVQGLQRIQREQGQDGVSKIASKQRLEEEQHIAYWERERKEKWREEKQGIDRVEDSKDLQQQSRALDKLTNHVEVHQLNSTRVQEAMTSISASPEADLNAMRLGLVMLIRTMLAERD
ncbi:hypothetical protein IFM89_019965 [Coptis chinensis]|uniref:DUF4283 domain-containing protein n=1 Tax=Coptis chinensis TaxID=261450 RepID=A0A835HFV2_9MAGN|nr:hypothetical protein IFM89_019965 [Coptis chinensis]